ncbi:MAG TPA: NADH-quinone oxidoreductase subunit L [Vicinamibacterales bacterium]|nr:NADH-quinone oxidoreductase subunit L [Vicinamibacterales bacterium]
MLLLIPLLPFLGFVVNAALGRRLPKAVSGGVACAAMLLAFAVSTMAVAAMMGVEARTIRQDVYTWLPSGELQVPFALLLDPLAAVMILVVTGIGSLIHIYSIGYMHEESDGEYARYFSYLNLFAAFMLVLVLGASFPVMFVGWEGVGLCSYLLIGFWFTKPSAADAGKKAFVVNRIGDFGFILGMLLIFTAFGTLDFQEVAAAAAARAPETAGAGVMTMATLLLFVGATGKSAQIPLHVWLPDAMEGPTPVSALIHAATMVTAGVYMIGRNAELFSHAPATLALVAAVGVATALMAGTIGLVQNDIKRVLAYSTVSQLGYMFLAMGVGAYAAGIFHLYTHAFFKALLFLGSGAVIHALAGEQDLRKMGGLKPYLPITYWTFLVGALAIAGIPGLSGFFSKDEILYKSFVGTEVTGNHGYPLFWVIGVITSLLTATYMFRLVFLAFHGRRRSGADPQAGHEPAAAHAHAQQTGHGHGAAGHGHAPHDAPPSMAVPLVVLAIGSVLAGYIGVPHALGGSNWIESFLHPSFEAHGAAPASLTAGAAGAEAAAAPHAPDTEGAHGGASTELLLMAISTGVAFAGIGIAAYFWLRRPGLADAMAERFRALYNLLYNKYYVDELYDAVIVQPIKYLSTAALWKGADAGLIDGSVNGIGHVVRGSSAVLRRLQTGSVRTYAASLFMGAVLILGWYLWM